MPTSPTIFDENLQRWTEEQQSLWSQLRYTVVHANLHKHLEDRPLRILDAGGGNGVDAIALARQDHHVDIVDYSTEMLAAADRAANEAGVRDRIRIHQAEVINVAQVFPAETFDVVLCHNVLQYVDDVPALLKSITVPLKRGGLLSLVSLNRYSIPYRAAFFRGDLAEAYAVLDRRSETAIVFGVTFNEYSADEISAMLPAADCVVDQHYGIRCICDYWGDNERKSDPVIFAQLEQLELALTDRHP